MRNGAQRAGYSRRILEAHDDTTWIRHPSDAARLVFNLCLLALMFGVVAIDPQSMSAASSELVQLTAELPANVRGFLAGTAQLLTFVLPVAMIGLALWTRRFRELALVGAAVAVAAGVGIVVVNWFGRAEPTETIEGYQFESWLTTAAFPSAVYLAGLTAAVTAASPLLERPWRRVGWGAIAAAVVVRLLTATQSPFGLVVTVVIGTAAASLVLTVVGAPARLPGAEKLTAAAARAGLTIRGLTPLQRVGGDGRWFGAETDDGTPVTIKYVDGDERDADLLSRLWRVIRVKGIEERGTGVAPEATISHEAMMTMLVAERGVRTPTVLGVADTERGALLVTGVADGVLLRDIEPDAVTDDVLAAVWTQVRTLYEQRVAHRQLDLDHIAVRGAEATIVRLRWSVPAASDELLAIDVADLLAATASLVGAERAARAALDVLGEEPLVGALPYLQRLALATQNKKVAKADKTLLPDLSDAIIAATGADQIELAEIERIGLNRVIGVMGIGVIAFFALGLASNWGDIADVFSEADLAGVPIMIALILLTNFAGAMSLMGAVATRPVPLGDTTIVMFAQGFVNRFTPANAGGMAMRIRYLQLGGTELSVSTASVSLTSIAGGIVQMVYILVFITWAGATASPDAQTTTPPWGLLAVAAGVVLVSIAIVMAIPKWRRPVVRLGTQFTQEILGNFRVLLHRPGKLAMLFGGPMASKLMTIITFVIACRAFDIDLSWAALASAYMVATTIGGAVPTPGGVGAIDAALVVALTGLGVDDAVAWSATLLFRLISYWMPILPSYIGLRMAQKRELF